MERASNDNRDPVAGRVRIIGQVVGDGRVVIADPDWRPAPPAGAPRLQLVDSDGAEDA